MSPLTRHATLAALLSILTPGLLAQRAPDALMLRNPDVSADRIVFQYASDLWLVGKDGGLAHRLTTVAGSEGMAKFSPDGARVAYMASYEGGSDLYVVAADGGLPRRVTHHPDDEVLCDWHPDGQRLLFFSSMLSGQRRAPKVFLVDADGGQPDALRLPYGTFGSFDEGGSWLAYTPLSRENRTWKRYQGGMAQDIWLFNVQTEEARQLTSERGTERLPMWHGRRVLYLSDRDELGIMNLYAHDVDSGEIERLTEFEEFDVRWPSVGPEDVVFENGGKLWRYELAGGRLLEVRVSIPSDLPALRPVLKDTQNLLDHVEIGPGAKRIVLEARGDVYTVPVEEGVTRNLTQTSGIAERSPSWSPDGKWIAYFSDRSGEYELVIRRPDGKTFDGADEHHERRLTELGEGWKWAPSWSPDSAHILFSRNNGELVMVDVESGESQVLDTHPAAQPIAASWSTDSAWLAWSRPDDDSLQGALFLREMATGETHQVTSGQFDDSEPTFDRDGKWLFFRSARSFQPIYSDFDTTWIYTNATNLMAVPLRADVEDPWGPKNHEEEVAGESEEEEEDGDEEEGSDSDEGDSEEDEDEDGGDSADDSQDDDGAQDDAAADEEASEDDPEGDEKEGEGGQKKEKEPIVVDVEGFEARAIQVPVDAGRLRGLIGLAGKVLYTRAPRTGTSGGSPVLQIYDMKEKKEEAVIEKVGAYGLDAKGEHLFVREGDRMGVVKPAPGQKLEKPIDLSGLRVRIDPAQEWEQVLVDAWRIFRDFFYDSGMHGLDWPAVLDRYRSALADATSRGDVHFLISEMMSELNVGHAYNRGLPKDGIEEPPSGPAAGLLGCDWKLEQGAYRIDRILSGGEYDADARSPLARQGVDAKEGDWLLAVNGIPVDPGQDVYESFLGTADKPTLLTLNAAPVADGNEREVLVKPLGGESDLRYRDWVALRRQWVEDHSGGRIGYVHVPDTGINGQNELVRQFMGQYRKEALIIDERWNSGGQIPTRFIELLDRPLTNFWATRHGLEWEWPPVGHRGPKAMLINHSSGSGGDAFPYYFRQSKLGKLIGTRTWGGLVGISGNPGLIDGARPSVPTFGFYELDGTWGVEGHGVDPDIEVVDDPSEMTEGQDIQLEVAVEHLLGELETYERIVPRRPAGPDRRRPGVMPQDH